MSKMRISLSLTPRHDEIKGTIELPGHDPAFVLEGLALIVERFALQSKVPADAIVRDLYSLVTGRVR